VWMRVALSTIEQAHAGDDVMRAVRKQPDDPIRVGFVSGLGELVFTTFNSTASMAIGANAPAATLLLDGVELLQTSADFQLIAFGDNEADAFFPFFFNSPTLYRSDVFAGDIISELPAKIVTGAGGGFFGTGAVHFMDPGEGVEITSDFSVFQGTLTTTGGDIRITATGTGAGEGRGIAFENAVANANGGDIEITANARPTSTTGFSTVGVEAINSMLETSGSGSITINGTGAIGQNTFDGLQSGVWAVNTMVRVVDGSITVIGQGAVGGNGSGDGVAFEQGSIEATGNGLINVLGTGGDGGVGVRLGNSSGLTGLESVSGGVAINGTAGTSADPMGIRMEQVDVTVGGPVGVVFQSVGGRIDLLDTAVLNNGSGSTAVVADRMTMLNSAITANSTISVSPHSDDIDVAFGDNTAITPLLDAAALQQLNTPVTLLLTGASEIGDVEIGDAELTANSPSVQVGASDGATVVSGEFTGATNLTVFGNSITATGSLLEATQLTLVAESHIGEGGGDPMPLPVSADTIFGQSSLPGGSITLANVRDGGAVLLNLTTLGGDIYFAQEGTSSLSVQNVTSGNPAGDPPVDGGDITILNIEGSGINIIGTVSSEGGVGGSVLMNNASGNMPIAGAGDIIIDNQAPTGDPVDVIITSPISQAADVIITALNDIIVQAAVESTGGDITLTADSDADGAGGVHVTATGQLDAARDVLVTASKLSTDPLAGIRIASNAGGDAIIAGRNIPLQNGLAAPVSAERFVEGSLLAGGDVSVGANNDVHILNNVTTSGGDVQIIAGDGAAVENNAVVSTNGGSVVVQGTGVTLSQATVDTDGGNVALHADDNGPFGRPTTGVRLLGSSVDAGSGSVDVIGIGGDGFDDGVLMQDFTLRSGLNTASINGTADTATTGGIGVRIVGTVNVLSGIVEFVGQGGPGGVDIAVQSGGQVNAFGPTAEFRGNTIALMGGDNTIAGNAVVRLVPRDSEASIFLGDGNFNPGAADLVIDGAALGSFASSVAAVFVGNFQQQGLVTLGDGSLATGLVVEQDTAGAFGVDVAGAFDVGNNSLHVSTGGSVLGAGVLIASGVTIQVFDSIDVNTRTASLDVSAFLGSIDVANDVTLSGDDLVVFGAVSAMADVTITQNGSSLRIDGTVEANNGGNVFIGAEIDVTAVSGSSTFANGTIHLDGGQGTVNLEAGSTVTADNAITITSPAGILVDGVVTTTGVSVGMLNVNGNVTINTPPIVGSADINLLADGPSPDDLVIDFDITDGQMVFTADGSIFVFGNITQTTGDLSFTAVEDIIIDNNVTVQTVGSGHIDMTANSNGDGFGGMHVRSGSSVIAAGNLSISGGDLTSTAAIDSAVIDGSLQAGGSIAVQSGAGGSPNGDVFVNGTVSAGGTIDIGAYRDITLSGAAVESLGGGDINLISNHSDLGGKIHANASSILSHGGNITLSGGSDPTATTYAVGTSEAAFGIYLQNTSVEVGSGTLLGRGMADSGNGVGVVINSGSVIRTTDGLIDFMGRGGTGGNNNFGIAVGDIATIEALGTGRIVLTGTGGGGVDAGRGLNLAGLAPAGPTITSVDGDILLTGVAGFGTGTRNEGIRVDNAALIATTGAGNIVIDGTGHGVDRGRGVVISGASKINTVNGSISISGRSNGTDRLGQGIGVFNRPDLLPQLTVIESFGNGDVLLNGTGSASGTELGVGVSTGLGTIIRTLDGTITVDGKAGGATGRNFGASFIDGAVVTAAGVGDIVVYGEGSVGGDDNDGVALLNAAVIQANFGSITIVGVAGAGAMSNDGIALSAASQVNIVNGAPGSELSLTGTSSGSGDQNSGVIFSDGSTASAAGNASLVIFGTGTDGLLSVGVGVALDATSFVEANSKITIEANTLDLGGELRGTSDVNLMPVDPAASIGIGDGMAGTFNVTNTELANILDRDNVVTWGRPDGSHTINLGGFTVSDAQVFQAPQPNGEINLIGPLTGLDDASFTFIGSGQTTNLAADITTAGNPVTFNDSVIVDGNVTLDTTAGGTVAGGADVTFGNPTSGETAGGDSLTVVTGAAGSVAFNSTVGTVALAALNLVNNQNVTFEEGVTAGSITQTGGSGTTTFNGPVNAGAGGVNIQTQNTVVNSTVETTGGGGVNISGGGASLAGNITTQSGGVNIQAPLTLNEDVVINTTGGGTGGAGVSLNQVNSQSGGESLTIINGDGNPLSLNGPIGDANPLGGLTQQGNSTTNLGGDIATNGPVSFGGPLLVGGAFGISTGGADATFTGPVDGTLPGGDTLAVDAGATGNALFNQPIGESNLLGIDILGSNNLTFQQDVNATNLSANHQGALSQNFGAAFEVDGPITLNGPGPINLTSAINSNGPATFGGPINIDGQVALNTSGGNATFNGPINGTQVNNDSLVLNTGAAGNALFNESIGESIALAIDLPLANDVTFAGPVNGPALVVNHNGVLTQQSGADFGIGGPINLAGPGPINLAGASNTNGGNFNVGGPITLTDHVVIDTTSGGAAGNATFGRIDAATGAETLTLNTGSSGDINFDQPVGEFEPPAAIIITNANDVTATGDVAAETFTQQSGGGTTTLPNLLTNDGTADITTGVSDVTLGSLAPPGSQTDFAAEAQGATSTTSTSGGAVSDSRDDGDDVEAASAELLGLGDVPIDPVFAQVFVTQFRQFEAARLEGFQQRLIEAVGGDDADIDAFVANLDRTSPLYNDLVEVAALLDVIDAMGLSNADAATARASVIARLTPQGVPAERVTQLVAAVRRTMLASAGG